MRDTTQRMKANGLWANYSVSKLCIKLGQTKVVSETEQEAEGSKSGSSKKRSTWGVQYSK